MYDWDLESWVMEGVVDGNRSYSVGRASGLQLFSTDIAAKFSPIDIQAIE